MGGCLGKPKESSHNKQLNMPRDQAQPGINRKNQLSIQSNLIQKEHKDDLASQDKNLAKAIKKEEIKLNYEKFQEDSIPMIEETIVNESYDDLREQKGCLTKYNIASKREEISRVFQSERREKSQINGGSEKRLKDLRNLYNLIIQNLSQSELIQGKDIVIILGATGAGKSTTINYLLGKKLEWSKVKNQTKSYVYETEGINVAKGEQEAAKIGTKPTESQTKSISVYPLTSKDQTRSILLCDTPGLLDTQGSIVDIANQVGIVKSLDKANSIKVLLLIGFKNLSSVEGKGKLMKEVIELYSKLIRDYDTSKESVLIGFTHLEKASTVEMISNSLKALTDTVSEEDGQNIQTFLDIAIKNLDSKSKLCCLVKPLQSDQRNSLVEQLFAIKSIPHEQVKDNFTYALAQNAKSEFELTLSRFAKDIRVLYEDEEYPSITERLNIIKLLRDEIEFNFVKKYYTDSLSGVIDLDLINRSKSQIQRIPSENPDNLPDLVESIVKVAGYLGWTDSIKKQHTDIEQSLISLNDLTEILSASLENCFTTIDSTDNFKSMSPYFDRLYQIYFCKDLESAFKQSWQSLISKRVYPNKQNIKSIYNTNYYKLACKSASDKLREVVEKLQSMQTHYKPNESKIFLKEHENNELRKQQTLKVQKELSQKKLGKAEILEQHIFLSMNEESEQQELQIAELESLLSKLKDLKENQIGSHLQINSSLLYSDSISSWNTFFQTHQQSFKINYKDPNVVIQQAPLMKFSLSLFLKANGYQRLIDEHFPNIPQTIKEINKILVSEGKEIIQRSCKLIKLRDLEIPVQSALEIISMSEEVRAGLQDSSQTLFAHLGTLVQKYSQKFEVGIQQLQSSIFKRKEEEEELNLKDDNSFMMPKDIIQTSSQNGKGSEFSLFEDKELETLQQIITSMGKRMSKMNKQFFLSFKFFSTLQEKSKLSLSKCLADILQHTQDEVESFSNTQSIIRGIYILQLASQQESFETSDQPNSQIVKANTEQAINKLTEKVSEVLATAQNTPVPNIINEEYQEVEESLANINNLKQFASCLITLQLVEGQSKQKVQEQIKRLDQVKANLLQEISQSIKHNVIDISSTNLPSDYAKTKNILDQLQKLQEFANVNQLLSGNYYEKVLALSIQEQKQLVDEISAYVQDNPIRKDYNQETAFKQLTQIRAANILYQSHFIGKLENQADNLSNELQLKQKGLDKKVKDMLKCNDFDSVIQHLKLVGEGTESYKSIKKYLKQKVKQLSASVNKKLEEEVTQNKDIFKNQEELQKFKEEFDLLDSSANKLVAIKYRNFKPLQQLEQSKHSLNNFQAKLGEKFHNKLQEQKISKASTTIAVATTFSNEFSSYLSNQNINVPQQMKAELKNCLAQMEQNFDIKNKQIACATLTSIKNVAAAYPKEFANQEASIKKKVNQLVLESALVFSNARVLEENFISVQVLETQLQQEYQSILECTLGDNYEQQSPLFFNPVLKSIEEQGSEVDGLFQQRRVQELLQLINNSKSAIIQKRILLQFGKYCDSLQDSIAGKNFSPQTQQSLAFLAAIAEGTRSYQYSQIKQIYLDLQYAFEQIFNLHQNTIIESLNFTLSDQASSELPVQLINYSLFTNIIAPYKYPFINHEPCFVASCQILDGIQQRFKDSVSTLDYRAFLSYLTAIDKLEQATTIYEGNKINTIEVYRHFILQIKGANPASQSLQQLTSIINGGFWTLQNIQQNLIGTRNKEVVEKVVKMLSQRNLNDASVLVRRFEDFAKKISSSPIQADSNSVLKLVSLKYTEKSLEAKQKLGEEIFDAKLFNLIEELADIEKYFEDIIVPIAKSKSSDEIVRNIEMYIENISSSVMKQNFEDETDVREFVQQLVNIRRIGFEIGHVHEFMLKTLSNIITSKFQTLSPQFVSDVSSKLRQDKLGLLIIQENNKNFEGLLNKMIEEVSKNQFSLEYVNSNIKGDNFIKEEFSSQYKTYEKSWKDLLFQWQQGSLKPTDILQKTKALFKKFVKANGTNYLSQIKIAWSQQNKQELAVMLAHVSAFWSVVNCQRQDDSFRKLHPVQVSTIMRLLSIDTTATFNTVENHLVQVKTGEGKSIILGITSCFLGLLGFYVDCCCYSSYLSGRDYSSFEHIFEQLEISSRIKYSTFEKQFEDIINDPTDMRQMGLDLIEQRLKQSMLTSKRFQEKRRILLIDEVDFFFGEDFLGRTYPVALYYSNSDVIAILKYIWENRSVHISQFKKTDVYKRLFINNPNLEPFQDFIDERIKMMYEDVNNLENHRYLTYTPSGKSKTIICYKSLDGISFNTVKGYKTAFAYIQEWEKRNITEEVMNENLAFIINVGSFSFAQIPQEYSIVLGVSGTLEDMSEYQKKLTRDLFNIKKLTVSPSIYGASKFAFNIERDVKVKENKALFYKEITSQIEVNMSQGRAVIAFFENKKSLDLFKSELVTSYETQVLSEETNFKGHAIVKAGSKGMITLATRPFGRGCDFISTDSELDKSGGIHVIQLFLSEDLAEETQVKGRTARQSQKGSYSLVMNKEDLCKNFGLPNDARAEQYQSYRQLHQLRLQNQSSKEIKLKAKLTNTLESHKESMELKQILLQYAPQHLVRIMELMLKFNKIADRTENKTNLYNFYSDFAGKIGIQEHGFEYDEHHNPKNVGLGNDGSFNDKTLLIGLFYTEEGLDTDVNSLLIPVLRQKGFKSCDVVSRESDFITKVPFYDQVWVVSGYKFSCPGYEKKFQDAIEQHTKMQKGLMIWADNNPYIVHANLILQRIPVGSYRRQPIHIKLDGSDYADQTLKAGSAFEPGQFAPHLITTGINNLHEGITICFPEVISNTPPGNFGALNIIGLSSSARPCFFVLSGSEDHGRIVFDCGFTKLMRDQWNTAGTVTYVTNCYAWLYWKERLFQNV